MRDLSPEFRALIEAEHSRVCWCWTITRADEIMLGFTDHDRDLTVGGVIHYARSGLTPSAVDSREGFAVDNSAIAGALDHESLDSAALAKGLFDGAQIILRRVSWENPDITDTVWAGRFGKITRSDNGFTADLVGPGEALNRAVGRVFSKMCDARFGDARCGVDAANYPEGTLCPRTFEACQSLFNNTVNFRGFPYLIGDDAMQAGPDSQAVRDGSSRYS
ncbi:DUF2163 domain-containing protein [Robiginitomaculum antarcticum]|uniref:DUF2163 domain-containing protein n=1 Tax=Robiginitomaculum antarcticum TaxID=437507 RepID=UPI00037E3AF4|nr:DUF2163 domain-containing protein [Robiginitomaculum antarcticum]